MKAIERINKDLREYCSREGCEFEEEVKKLSMELSEESRLRLGDVTDEVYAWSALQEKKHSTWMYHKSEQLGEFIYNSKQFSLYGNDTFPSLRCIVDRTAVDFPEGCINVYEMFSRHYSKGFKIRKFDTSGVTNMNSMFRNSTLPEGFTLGSKFDTSSVTDMSHMFDNCKMPDGFTLGKKFDTSNVKLMEGMFRGCKLPKGFTLGGKFDTSNVKSMFCMFQYSELPEGFSLGDKFSLSSIEHVKYMFSSCKIPDDFTLGDEFNSLNVAGKETMFLGCEYTGDLLKDEIKESPYSKYDVDALMQLIPDSYFNNFGGASEAVVRFIKEHPDLCEDYKL